MRASDFEWKSRRRRKGADSYELVIERRKTTETRAYDELKGILEERRREIMSEVQGRMRDVRAEGAGSAVQGVLDAAESSELDIQDEIEFALIQMKAETLNKIDEALRRLEEGTYGYCFECGEEISEKPAARAAVRGPLQGL